MSSNDTSELEILIELKKRYPFHNTPACLLTDRELKLMANCENYVTKDPGPGGLPAHNILVLVSKLILIIRWLTHA